MKTFYLIIFFLFSSISAQKISSFDTLSIADVKDFFADDYGNVYILRNQNFGLTKYDSLAKQQGKMMLTVPYKIQSVQNPLNIVLFSENAQQIKFIDQNLNEIQNIDLRRFGFIRMAYAEDLQQIWLLDDSMKRLVQYNFREDKIINSFPLNMSFDEIKDFLVFVNQIYLIREKEFLILDFKGIKQFSAKLENPIRLRRENDRLYVIGQNKIERFLSDKTFKTVYSSPSAQIVDKNSSAYFEIRDNKVYLYKLE